MIQHSPRRSRKNSATSTKRIFRFNLFMGGAKKSIIRDCLNRTQASECANEATLVIDNQAEIEAIREKYDHKNISTFVKGEGLTTRAASRQCSPRITAAVGNTNNSGMAEGFGGRGLNARLAAERLIQSANFKDYLDTLPDLALAATNGAPGRIEIEAYGSICGSAYASAIFIIVYAIVTRLVALGVEVKVRYHALGPSTFTGIAKRGWQNAACAILQHLLHMADLSQPELDLVTRELILHELPLYKDDWDARENLLRYDASTMRCKELRAHFNLIQSNHNMDGRWGGVVSRQVGFFPGLDQEKEIAGLVAQSLREELQNDLLSLESDPLLVAGLQWRDESVPERRLAMEEILEQVEATPIDETCRRIAQVEWRSKFRIFLETAEGTEFDLEKLSVDFCSTPSTVSDFRYRLQLLAACMTKLHEEQRWVEDDLSQIADEILELEPEVQRLCDRIQTGSIFGVRRYQDQMEKSAQAIRSLYERRAVEIAEREALHRAIAETKHVQEQHMASLTDIEKTLDTFIPRGSVTKIRDFVSVSRLERVFIELAALPQLAKWEQVDRLCGFATQLTAKGLAEILGENSDRLEILADRIVQAEYPIESPHHGARLRNHPAQVFYILPPMPEAMESQLRQLIQTSHDGAKVMFCDSLICGATVMRMSLFRFDTVAEIFDGILGHALKQALDDPLAALNATDLRQGIETLGGRIVGDRVLFDEPVHDASQG